MLKKSLKLIVTIAIAIQLYFLLRLGLAFFLEVDIETRLWLLIVGSLGILVLAYLLASVLLIVLEKLSGLVRHSIEKITVQEMLGGLLGMLVGLVVAILLGNSIYKLPIVGPYFYVLVAVFFAYLGWTVGVRRREEFAGLLPRSLSRSGRHRHTGTETVGKLVDTSVIIDGRIADIWKCGFIEGDLVVPGFVLEELQKIADSSDSLKRNRGRRGLDILGKMQKEPGVTVRVEEKDYDDLSEVDAKLVRMAQEKGMSILTNDFNLNKVAQLQGIRVLNINDLANAVKPVVLPGEEFRVTVLKEGKEASQGIGYLDDGTMVVVEGGRRLVGETIGVVVTSILQTSAGRMIFARPAN